MFHVCILEPKKYAQTFSLINDGTLGKATDCTIQLDHWRVAKTHARLFETKSGIILEDLGTFSGVLVNGKRIDTQHGPLAQSDVIEIGPFKISVQIPTKPSNTSNAVENDTLSHAHSIENSRNINDQAQIIRSESTALIVSAQHTAQEFEWRHYIHEKLIETMDIRRHDIHSMSDEALRESTAQLIKEIIDTIKNEIPSSLNLKQLGKQVLDEAIGLGVLEELLDDPAITEIMVNRFDEIYVERYGRLLKHPTSFTSNRAVLGVIERIVSPLGRRIDESSPMVDARLKDGSRVNAIIPPLALKGACLTIRKFSKNKLNAQDLVKFGSLNQAMADFLKICVETKKNIIVSGGTGSGKTTLLNILSNFIPSTERIITIEDAAELKLHHDHLISLESKPMNVEGKGGISIRDLVKNTLRMRPDRIVVGECRGAEALDMLQAMNTGHEGSLTTLHANTPRDALARLETMILMAGMDLPLSAIREQIASTVHIIVQQTRFACGTRKVTHIVEVTGVESGVIQLQEIFKFVPQGYQAIEEDHPHIQGYFTASSMVPHFYEALREMNYPLDLSIFQPTHKEIR